MTAAAVPAFVERGGGDAAIIMLHGVGGAKSAFPHQLEAFAAYGLRSVAWDMPGYGESGSVEPYTMAALADALGRLIDATGARRTIVLGHSMGGMVAQEAMIRCPGKIHGLVLLGTSPAFGKADGDWQKQFLAARLKPLDEGRSMRWIAERLIPTMAGTAATNPSWQSHAIDMMAAVPPATYRHALQALAGFDRRATLDAISVPSLLIAGGADTTAPASVMAKMAQKMPNASFVELPGLGHLANIEGPEAVSEAVITFIGRAFQKR